MMALLPAQLESKTARRGLPALTSAPTVVVRDQGGPFGFAEANHSDGRHGGYGRAAARSNGAQGYSLLQLGSRASQTERRR